ncbi:MAG: three-Cys-motif partner protein TcmP [Desulforudis sp.]|nr:MAG: three-Cys-motif partner protein TcmP [Desulforudis sp.]
MNGDAFFDERSEQSLIKASIVAKYFWAWATVISSAQKKSGRLKGRIAYVDLFSVPGRYKDGTGSTPLAILEQAIGNPELRDKLITVFNDVDKGFSESLKREILNLSGVETLRFKPLVYSFEVGDEIVEIFERFRLVPTLLFVDPWGYKGLSLRLISSVLKDWGCECILFFNYNRISMGIQNDAVKLHMDALFGEERAQRLRSQTHSLRPHEREFTIVEEIVQALRQLGGKYVLPFRFRNNRGTRTSHHLIFVSKHLRGYNIMKEIMARRSSRSEFGVPSFEYNPADRRYPVLFELSRPLDELGEMLLEEFAGKNIKMKDIYERHHVGRPFIARNYKAVLINMEEEGRIIADPPAERRPKNTFGDNVRVIFPPKGD